MRKKNIRYGDRVLRAFRAKRISHEQIEVATAEYLAKGGKIRRDEPLLADAPSTFNAKPVGPGGRIVATNPSVIFEIL